MLDIWSILLLIGIFQGIFLAVIFFHKGRSYDKANNHVFAAFLLAISYILAVEFLHESGLIQDAPHLLATSTPVIFMLGPLIYLYICSLVNPNFTFSRGTLIHFIPVLVCIAAILPFYLQSSTFKINYIQQSVAGPVELPASRAYFYGFGLLQNGLYWWLCYSAIGSLNHEIKPFIKRWLLRITVVYGGFLICYLLVFVLFLAVDFYLREIRYGGYLLLSFSVHLYSYLLLQESRPVEKIHGTRKYMNSTLGSREITTVKKQLLELMEREKPYLDSTLRLEQVANRLEVSAHQLSQVINTECNTNFNAFINRYRIREAKQMLHSDRFASYSLEGIAMECGFGNRTSFYRAFRKQTGTTPADFKKMTAG